MNIDEDLKKFIKEKNLHKNEVCEFIDDIDVELYKFCLLLRNDLHNNDERIVLMNNLVLLGLSEQHARIIALDAGASQIVVNNEYLNDFKIDKDLMNKVKAKLCDFYMGE